MMATQAEVNAARDAYRDYMQEHGAPRGYLHMLHEAAIRHGLDAAEGVRDELKRLHCKHPRATENGMISSDGSSFSSWSCPDCGSSGAFNSPPRDSADAAITFPIFPQVRP